MRRTRCGRRWRPAVRARLGDTDLSIGSLELAYNERQLAMTEIGIEPALDSLRSDGRFKSLLRRVNLAR